MYLTNLLSNPLSRKIEIVNSFPNQIIDPYKITAATLFGELSNLKDKNKQKQEAIATLNTIQNRMKESQQSLLDVVTTPKQYKAYNPAGLANQYWQYFSSNADYNTRKKIELVNELVEKFKNNQLKDITNGANFYYHTSPLKANIGSAYFYKAKPDYPRNYPQNPRK